MAIQINQTTIRCDENEMLAAVLERYCHANKLDLGSIAVATAGQVLPRSQWQHTAVVTHPHYTVFSAVAGG